MTNIVMISIDDLNDWTSPLRGYAGTVYTPNIQRIADQATTFGNAFTTSPGCNQSRTATLSGLSPLTTGVLTNDQFAFDFIDPAQTLPALLRAAGYTTATAGKVFHDLPPEQSALLYDRDLSPDYGIRGDKDPDNLDPSIPGNDDVGPYTGDPALLTDVLTTGAVAEFLATYAPAAGSAGLFLSVGLSRPHSPWIVPKEYFDLYPLDAIVVPESMPDDLLDIPAFAQSLVDPEDVAGFTRADWAKLIQGYLAAVSFADAMLGRLMDAIAGSAIAQDTVMVFWSDHGYHLGEKDRFGKGTLWEEATRSQFTVLAPGASTAGQVRDEVVSLLDLLPTVLDYAGVATPDHAEGRSLRTLIEDGRTDGLPGYAVTSLRGSHSLRTEDWRYTRYEDGSEELYDLRRDPQEIDNRADAAEVAVTQALLSARLDDHLAGLGVAQSVTDVPTVLKATGGARLLIGGYGADTLIGSEADNVYVTRGPDVRIVEARDGGTDWVLARGDLTLPANVENVSVEIVDGPNPNPDGIRTIVGNVLDNRILCHAAALDVEAGAGDDTVVGGSREDLVRGGNGRDLLEGGSAADTLDGGGGDDTLDGGLGDDLYRASAGDDRIEDRAEGRVKRQKLTEEGGIDRIDVTGWGGLDRVRITEERNAEGTLLAVVLTDTAQGHTLRIDAIGGASPIEALIEGATQHLLKAADLPGTGLADRLLGSDGNDTLRGLDGDDTLDGGAGVDSLDGGAGFDIADHASATRGVKVKLDSGAGKDRLQGFEGLAGSAFGDRLTGSRRDDLLSGDAGDDDLRGSDGDDTLEGGMGADVLDGGKGADRFVFLRTADGGTTTFTADRIVGFEAGEDAVILTGIDADAPTPDDDAFTVIGDAPITGRGQLRIVQDGKDWVIELNTQGDAAPELVLRIEKAKTFSAEDILP